MQRGVVAPSQPACLILHLALSLSLCFFMLITHTGLGQHPYRSLISHITRISHNASSHISQSPPNTHLVVRRTQSGIHAGLYHYRHPASLLSYTFYPLFPSIHPCLSRFAPLSPARTRRGCRHPAASIVLPAEHDGFATIVVIALLHPHPCPPPLPSPPPLHVIPPASVASE